MDGAELDEDDESPDDEDWPDEDVESSDEDVESSDEDVESSDEAEDDEVVVVTCAVVVVVPIEPSQAIAPQASTNVASTAATTRRRIRPMRRARAASRSRPRAARSEVGGVDMRTSSAAPPRADSKNPENLLGTAAIFDLDGVLVDSRVAITHCLNQALAANGHPTQPPEELYRFIGPPQATGFAELIGAPIDSEAVRACTVAYRACYAETSLANTSVFPGIPEALEALARDHRLAVATSKPGPFAESLLAGLGLRDRFEAVAGPAFDAHDSKARTLEVALEALGRPRAVMIGDRSFDMVGAAAHGLPGIGVAWGIGSRAELTEAGAARIVESPADLPAAVAELI
jgi:phosphoglycolate phosphatase